MKISFWIRALSILWWRHLKKHWKFRNFSRDRAIRKIFYCGFTIFSFSNGAKFAKIQRSVRKLQKPCRFYWFLKSLSFDFFSHFSTYFFHLFIIIRIWHVMRTCFTLRLVKRVVFRIRCRWSNDYPSIKNPLFALIERFSFETK